MPNATNLTTVETALAEKLTPKGEPCTTDVAPHGVFTNGASLPNTAGQNAGQVVATATPARASTDAPTTAPTPAATTAPSAPAVAPDTSTRSAPLKLEIGKQYVVRQADGTHEYHQLVYKGTTAGALFYRGARCPEPGRLNQINIFTIEDILTVEEAVAAKLTMTNAPCNPSQVPHGS